MPLVKQIPRSLNSYQLSVSPVGADDDTGLGIGLYSFRVVGDDGGPVQGEVGVTV